MITRPLLAIYVVTSEQNPFGKLISQPNNIRKWVVEKSYGISPGLSEPTVNVEALLVCLKTTDVPQKTKTELTCALSPKTSSI